MPTSYSATIRSEPSRSIRIASKSYQHGKKTVHVPGFQFLVMSKHLTEGGSRDSSTLSPAGSLNLARTYLRPARAQESPESDRDFGEKWRESSARFDLGSCSPRTLHYSGSGGSKSSSATLPFWGTMRNGSVYQRRTSERPIKGTGSGYSQQIPTATANDSKSSRNATAKRTPGSKHSSGTTQADFVTLWPTPTANRYGSGQNGCPGDGRKEYKGKGSPSLHTMATRGTWPTPTVQDSANNGGPSQHKRNSKPLNAVAGGQLNPQWVELLMGWPPGWTSLEPIDAVAFVLWQVAAGHWPETWEDGTTRVAEGVSCRVQRLKAIGNGQVPAAAAVAWRQFTPK